MKPTKLTLTGEQAKSLYPTASPEFKAVLETTFGKPFFEWDPIKSINSFEDVLKFHSFPHMRSFLDEVCDLTSDEIAYRQLKLIISAYNNNEKPDWGNSNQLKYYPLFHMVGSASGFSYFGYAYGHSVSHIGSRLVFLKKEHMVDATEKFKEIFQRFFGK